MRFLNSGPRNNSPHRPWFMPMKPASISAEYEAGCTVPQMTSTPVFIPISSEAAKPWMKWGSCRSFMEPCAMTIGSPTTNMADLIRCATPTTCGSLKGHRSRIISSGRNICRTCLRISTMPPTRPEASWKFRSRSSTAKATETCCQKPTRSAQPRMKQKEKAAEGRFPVQNLEIFWNDFGILKTMS